MNDEICGLMIIESVMCHHTSTMRDSAHASILQPLEITRFFIPYADLNI